MKRTKIIVKMKPESWFLENCTKLVIGYRHNATGTVFNNCYRLLLGEEIKCELHLDGEDEPGIGRDPDSGCTIYDWMIEEYKQPELFN